MNFTKNQKDIMYNAIQKYGQSAQVDKSIEEMAELTKALLKQRYSEPTEELHEKTMEELADVMIMCCQLELMFDDGLLKFRIEKKLNRLELRIREGG